MDTPVGLLYCLLISLCAVACGNATGIPVITALHLKNPNQKSFMEGERIQLLCIFNCTAFPCKTFSWKLERTPKTSEILSTTNRLFQIEQRDKESRLTFSNINRMHDGKYSCQAENDRGKSDWSKAFPVDVLYKPYLVDADNYQKQITAVAGQTVTLSVIVTAKPTTSVDFTWAKIQPKQDSRIDVTDKINISIVAMLETKRVVGNLILSNVSVSDGGIYRVLISNSVGRLTLNKTLLVNNVRTEVGGETPPATGFPNVTVIAAAVAGSMFVIVLVIVITCLYCKYGRKDKRIELAAENRHRNEYKPVSPHMEEEVTYSDIKTEAVPHTDDGLYALPDKKPIQESGVAATKPVDNQAGKTPVLIGDDGIEYIDPNELDLKEHASDAPPKPESTVYAQLQ